MPWVTYDAMEVLENVLTKSSRVFEFGAGGSTLFFLDYAGTVFSVEHNPEWLSLLEGAVSTEEKQRWVPVLAEPEPGGQTARYTPADPEGYLSLDEMYVGGSFQTYATAIEQYEKAFFDVVLVDGRARPSCIMHSLDKVKTGGLLVVDNAERTYYFDKTLESIKRGYDPVLQAFGSIPYNKTFTKTAIWRKR